MKISLSLVFIPVYLLISACNVNSEAMPTNSPIPALITATPELIKTNTPQPTITHTAPIPTKAPTPSAKCSDVSVNWQATPSAKWAFTTKTTLPIEIGNQLTHEELAAALFCQYLEIYKSPQAENRITDYTVNAFLDERLQNLQKEINADFVAGVSFSVLPELYGDWAAGNGILSDDGWVRDKFLIIGVFKRSGVYEMKIIGTGP
jgi:hypothetical protein